MSDAATSGLTTAVAPLRAPSPGARALEAEIARLVETALSEDLGYDDATSRATLPRSALCSAVLVNRAPGVICGLSIVEAVFKACPGDVATRQLVADGDAVEAGTALLALEGDAIAVLAGERTALNFLGHLSGIATLTRRYVDAVEGTDNATSCSSENSVVIVDEVYEEAVAALGRAGGYLASPAEKEAIRDTLWVNGKLNRAVIAKDARVFAAACGLGGQAPAARFFMVEETGVGRDHPFSDEKLALVLTVYRAANFDDAVARVREILEFKGKGHSVGIHTEEPAHARRLAEELDTARVLVNMAHTFGNGGGFDSGLNFTLSMGCGTWQGNSISENLNYRHFLNITHLAVPIPEDRPSEEALFAAHWEKYGR